jgi:hypothetical protein
LTSITEATADRCIRNRAFAIYGSLTENEILIRLSAVTRFASPEWICSICPGFVVPAV